MKMRGNKPIGEWCLIYQNDYEYLAYNVSRDENGYYWADKYIAINHDASLRWSKSGAWYPQSKVITVVVH